MYFCVQSSSICANDRQCPSTVPFCQRCSLVSGCFKGFPANLHTLLSCFLSVNGISAFKMLEFMPNYLNLSIYMPSLIQLNMIFPFSKHAKHRIVHKLSYLSTPIAYKSGVRVEPNLSLHRVSFF